MTLDLDPVWLTLRLAAVTVALLLVVGTPLAWWLAHTRTRVKPLVEAVTALPLVLPPMAFVAVLDIARMMIFESVLGFLGLGVQPPTPTFGNIIADGRKYLMNAWWIATMPGVFLVLVLTSINLMGASLERARNAIYGGA